MIVEYIKKPAGTSRGFGGPLSEYILGATKGTGINKGGHTHTGDAQKVHYLCSSKNLCISDPLYTKTKGGEVIKINGQDAVLKEIKEAFAASEALNTNVKYPIEHIMLSLPPGESLSMEQWERAVEIFINHVGYDNCTWISSLHLDTKKEHVHIALCNISNEAPHRSVNPSNKWQLATEARMLIEKEFGLSHTESPLVDSNKDFNPNLSKNRVKNVVREAIRDVMQKNRYMTLPQFMKEMQKRDVGVFASLKKNEDGVMDAKVQGLSFSYQGNRIQASVLGKNFKTSDILENVTYDKNRDFDEVTLLNEHEKSRMEAFDAIRAEMEEKVDELVNSDDDLFVIANADMKDIDGLFDNGAQFKVAEKGSTAMLAGLKIRLDNDTLASTEAYVANDSASKYYTRKEKELLAKRKAKLKKEEEKRKAALLKLIRDIVSSFCATRPCDYEKDYNPYTGALNKLGALIRYGIDSNAPSTVLTRRELERLLLRIKVEDSKFRVIKGLDSSNGNAAILEPCGHVTVFKPVQNNERDQAKFEMDLTYSY